MNFKNYIHQIPGGALPPSPWPGGGLEPRSPPVLYAYGFLFGWIVVTQKNSQVIFIVQLYHVGRRP